MAIKSRQHGARIRVLGLMANMAIEKEERRVAGMLTGGGLFCEFKTHKKNRGHPNKLGRHC